MPIIAKLRTYHALNPACTAKCDARAFTPTKSSVPVILWIAWNVARHCSLELVSAAIRYRREDSESPAWNVASRQNSDDELCSIQEIGVFPGMPFH